MATVYWYLYWGAILWAILVIPVWIIRFATGNKAAISFVVSLVAMVVSVKLMVLPFLDGFLAYRSQEEMYRIGVKFWSGLPFLMISVVAVVFRDLIEMHKRAKAIEPE